MLSPAGRAPERFVIPGLMGAGKTRGWMQIADLAVKTHSPARFHVIDTDFTVYRSMEEFPAIEPIVDVYEVEEWPEYVEAIDKILPNVDKARGDWVISDRHDKSWAKVQDDFVEEVFGMDAGDYFLQARKAFETDAKAKSFTVFDGWVDWQVINRRYSSWAMKVMFRHRSHVYLVTSAEKLITEGKTAAPKEDRMLYGDIGVKPTGQKHTGHEAHTVLLMTHMTQERWTATTIKDRGGRRYLKDEPITNFAMDYLRKVAGWTL